MIEELYYNKNYNLKKAIELIFTSENPMHTGLMISKLNLVIVYCSKLFCAITLNTPLASSLALLPHTGNITFVC